MVKWRAAAMDDIGFEIRRGFGRRDERRFIDNEVRDAIVVLCVNFCFNGLGFLERERESTDSLLKREWSQGRCVDTCRIFTSYFSWLSGCLFWKRGLCGSAEEYIILHNFSTLGFQFSSMVEARASAVYYYYVF